MYQAYCVFMDVDFLQLELLSRLSLIQNALHSSRKYFYTASHPFPSSPQHTTMSLRLAPATSSAIPLISDEVVIWYRCGHISAPKPYNLVIDIVEPLFTGELKLSDVTDEFWAAWVVVKMMRHKVLPILCGLCLNEKTKPGMKIMPWDLE